MIENLIVGEQAEGTRIALNYTALNLELCTVLLLYTLTTRL